MRMGPRVSVVVPSFNQEGSINETISSILDQTLRPAQVVVVDDGSTDRTARELEKLGAHITVIEQANCGVSLARNRGASLVNGDFISFCDGDDVWHRDKLAMQTDLLLSDSTIRWCHVGVRFENSASGNEFDVTSGISGWVLQHLLRLDNPGVLGGGSGVLMWRESFNAVQGFHPKLSIAADWHLFVRLAACGKLGFVPEVLLTYRLHSANMSRNYELQTRDMFLAIRELQEMGLLGALQARLARGRVLQWNAGARAHDGKPYGAARSLSAAVHHDPRVVVVALRKFQRYLRPSLNKSKS